MRVDCGRLDPSAVICADFGECYPCAPERLDEEEHADWRAGRDAINQLGALTVGGRPAWRLPTDKRPSTKTPVGGTEVFGGRRSSKGEVRSIALS
jgi:hypothetical protein